MFHHFHSDFHSSRPGSLSGEDLEKMLDFLESEFRIVSPQDFVGFADNPRAIDRTVVLTFDDALLSQIDVAAPILRERGYAAVFSVYSSVFSGRPDPLEIFASFRAEAFPDFLAFWHDFERAVLKDATSDDEKYLLRYPDGYLADFPFYTPEERKFRFLRDEVLGPVRYFAIMWSMINTHSSFNPELVQSRLWMNSAHLFDLVSEGHSIGLHSHSHPTRIDEMPRKEQAREYQQNFDWIYENLGVKPDLVAHPCGRYSSDTLEILEGLGVKVGFRSTMTGVHSGSHLEVPREDHANILRQMKAA
jgi:peptidoglycan/xylan/chitin deacetylase (PgdA/CDA1 family)